MKKLKLFLLFIVSMLTTVTFAQEDKGYKMGFYGPINQHPVIVANKQLESGARWVQGSEFYTTIKNSSYRDGDKLNCQIGLSVEMYRDGEPVYFLNITALTAHMGSLCIYKDSPLLIKLSNDEVIKLRCDEDAIDRVGEIVSLTYNVTKYTVHAHYQIHPDDIDLFQNGIKKIRFEANAEKWDFEFKRHKKDELGEFLYNSKTVITEALNNQDDNFEEGF